jgi:hypothetical protein
MTRTTIVRLLLSLLLLVSQQMATSHALLHWGGALDITASALHQERAGDLSSAFAQDQTCTQCLAFAQLAGPLGSQAPAFVVPDSGRGAGIATNDAAACARTICVFQSRAPPLA